MQRQENNNFLVIVSTRLNYTAKKAFSIMDGNVNFIQDRDGLSLHYLHDTSTEEKYIFYQNSLSYEKEKRKKRDN